MNGGNTAKMTKLSSLINLRAEEGSGKFCTYSVLHMRKQPQAVLRLRLVWSR